jgi:hypothetical protein
LEELRFLIKFRSTFLTASLVLGLLGCTSPDVQEYDAAKASGPKQKVFEENFEKIWRAAQLALSNYPIRVNDMESGVIESDFIRGDDLWKSPIRGKPLPNGLRYKVIIRILKGSISEKAANQVTVLKRIEFKKDFFSEYEAVKTDGLEEIAILYRIERELVIQQALEKAKF